MADKDKPVQATSPSESNELPPNVREATPEEEVAWAFRTGLARHDTFKGSEGLRILADASGDLARRAYEAKPDPTVKPNTSRDAPMAEGPVPRTWKEFIPQTIWYVLILGCGLELVISLLDGHYGRALLALVGLLGLGAMLLHSDEIKARLFGINPNWIVAAVSLLLAAIIFSPYVEQHRWPFLWQLAPTQPPAKRNIIPATPEHLLSLYENVMSSQGDKLLALYAGNWIQVTQTVNDTRANEVWTYTKGRAVVLLFDSQKDIESLQRGQSISALCQIAFPGSANKIYLAHCELNGVSSG